MYFARVAHRVLHEGAMCLAKKKTLLMANQTLVLYH